MKGLRFPLAWFPRPILARLRERAVLLALAVIVALPGTGPAGAVELRGHDIIVAHGLTERKIRLLVEARRDGSEAGLRMAADLARRLGVGQEALSTFLDILAGKGDDGGFLPGFAETAARHAALIDRLAMSVPAADPFVAALVGEARAELAAGNHVRADELLAGAEKAAREGTGDAGGFSLPAAALRAERGELSLLRLDLPGAAKHFRMAAEMVPPEARIEHADYLGRCMGVLVTHGRDEGDADTLARIVEALHAMLPAISREEAPLQWAAAQNHLGKALSELGKLKNDPALLERSVLAHRAALEERMWRSAPADRTSSLNDLAGALKALGEKRWGTKEMEEAVALYREALEGLSRERAPIGWARVRSDMGHALAVLGKRTGDPALLHEAVGSFRSAMEEITRQRMPFDWSMGQYNLGKVWEDLAPFERDLTLLEQAAEAYRAALEEWTRERKPLLWADAQKALASTLYWLGAMQMDPALLEQAADAYRAAMEVRTRELGPREWAGIQSKLGDVLLELAEVESGTASLEQAAEAFRSAIEAFKAEELDYEVPFVASKLHRARTALKERRADPAPSLPR